MPVQKWLKKQTKIKTLSLLNATVAVKALPEGGQNHSYSVAVTLKSFASIMNLCIGIIHWSTEEHCFLPVCFYWELFVCSMDFIISTDKR